MGGRHVMGAAGLSLLGYSLLQLARHSTHPPVLWLGATTSFIGALSLLRRGWKKGGDHEVVASHVEVVN